MLGGDVLATWVASLPVTRRSSKSQRDAAVQRSALPEPLMTLRPTALLAVLVVVACTGELDDSASHEAPASPFVQWDSAGVQITAATGTAAFQPIGWSVEATPDLVLGASNDPEKHLYRVGGIQLGSGGGFILVDGGSRQIRFFDASGRLVDRVGGHGEGPGEFGDPVLVPAVGTDSLLVWDQDLHRFQVFSPDGRNHRTVRLQERWPAGGRPPVGALGLATMLVRSRWVEWFMVPESRETGGGKEETTTYFWYDPLTGARTNLASFTVVGDYHWLRRGGSPPVGMMIPFVAKSSAVVAPGRALITDGASFEVREYDHGGNLKRVFRVDESPGAVTPGLVDRHAELTASEPRYVENMRERYAEMPIPEVLPAFEDLLIDQLGWLWARVYELDSAKAQRWMVFDAEGQARGSVETPIGLDVQAIGADYVLGVWVDDLGVEYVRRHRLERNNSPAPE